MLISSYDHSVFLLTFIDRRVEHAGKQRESEQEEETQTEAPAITFSSVGVLDSTLTYLCVLI